MSIDGIDTVILALAAMADAAPPEVTECPNCGTRKHPREKEIGGIVYWNCRDCDFSTWDREEYLGKFPEDATDEEIERSFDAYR